MPRFLHAVGMAQVVGAGYSVSTEAGDRATIVKLFRVALLLPIVIRSAVVEGVATATEVSTIGIVYAVLAGLLLYRQFDWRRLMPMLLETAALVGADPRKYLRYAIAEALGGRTVPLPHEFLAATATA